MMIHPKLTGVILGAGLAALSLGLPSISDNCVRAYHSAIQEANHGQKGRALATLDCLLMPRGVTVGLGTSGAMSKAVDRGVAVWADRLPNSPFAFTSDNKPDLKVVFVDSIARGGDVQGEVHCQRQVFWGANGSRYRISGTIQIRDNVDGRPLTSTEATSVIEHELGHVLGLEDDEDTGKLMGPFVAGSPVDGPTFAEVQLVESFRGAVRDVAKQVVGGRYQETSRGVGTRGHRSGYGMKRISRYRSQS